jgi:hypothetical protein
VPVEEAFLQLYVGVAVDIHVYIRRIPVATTTVWGIRDTASQIVVKSW